MGFDKTQRMFFHIEGFVQYMNRKGYDGMFVSNYGFPGKLSENLTKHVFQCYEDQKIVDKIRLTTYSHWSDEDKPYIRCTFNTEFTYLAGFWVKNLQLEKADNRGVFTQEEIAISHPEDLPTLKEANTLMLEKRRPLKL